MPNGKPSTNGNGLSVKLAMAFLGVIVGVLGMVVFDAITHAAIDGRITMNAENHQEFRADVIQRLAIIETRQIRTQQDVAAILARLDEIRQ